ncbi:MAG TPA: hypothetical protein VFS60_02600, partial [Thermoanaerobaculia bacterium]|nr:hypothetical protein [Thermoanaerobaculia bacterium]
MVRRYNEPPAELARTLGGLGELAAARAVLEETLRIVHPVAGGANEPVLKVLRALARLLLAQEAMAEAITLLEEIADTRDRLDDPAAARAAREELALVRAHATAAGARRRPAVVPRLPRVFEPPNSHRLDVLYIGDSAAQVGSSMREIDHPAFDSIVSHGESSLTAAFEKTEDYRASVQTGVSLLRRLHGARDAALYDPAKNPQLAALDAQIQAVTRALDRIE